MSIQYYSDWAEKYGSINFKEDYLRWKFAIKWRAERLCCCFFLLTLPSFTGFIIILIFRLIIEIQDLFNNPPCDEQAFISFILHIGIATLILTSIGILFSIIIINKLEKIDYDKLRKENNSYRENEAKFISQYKN